MGPTGAGKTTFVNIALKEDYLKVGHSVNSTTSVVQPIVIDPIPDFPALRGRRLVLVDTPGFDDTFVDDVQTLKRIADWLAQTYKKKMPIGGVLYLHDISVKRFNATARKNLEMFHHLCGDSAMQKVVLLTTNWDSPLGPSADYERREKELQSVYWKDLIDRKAETHRFLRNYESAWKVIHVLLQQFAEYEHLTLLIQTEIVERKLHVPQTEAGRVLLNTLQEALKACNDVANLEASMAHGADAQSKAKLDDAKANVARLKAQIKSLNVSFSQRVLQWIGIN